MRAPAVHYTTHVSMVSLRWGEVLSTLLPGSVVVLALSWHVQQLDDWFTSLDSIGPGVALLMASALAGGGLEALTRVTWEKLVLAKICAPPRDVLTQLTPENFDLYDRLVQGSYKYVTFYSNLGFALIVTLASMLSLRPSWGWPLTLAGVIVLLFYASYVQWTYFVHYATEIFSQKEPH